MTDQGRYHGGLVFFGFEDGLLDRFARTVAATLDDYGHKVERLSVQSRHLARVTTSRYHISLTVICTTPDSDQLQRARRLDTLGKLNQNRSPVSEFPCRLVVDICAADPARDDKDISELLLVVMLYRLVDTCEASAVEWLEPGTVLTLNQFMAAFADIAPFLGPNAPVQLSAARGGKDKAGPVCFPDQPAKPLREPVPDHGQTGLVRLSEDQTLAMSMRTKPHPKVLEGDSVDAAQSDIRRLATWGMTGMLSFLSAPAAASMVAVNLIRGEDFRMNTQVLSLTALLVTLQSSGALASAMAHIPV